MSKNAPQVGLTQEDVANVSATNLVNTAMQKMTSRYIEVWKSGESFIIEGNRIYLPLGEKGEPQFICEDAEVATLLAAATLLKQQGFAPVGGTRALAFDIGGDLQITRKRRLSPETRRKIAEKQTLRWERERQKRMAEENDTK